MCAAFVWTGQRHWARAAIAVLAAVVVGRLLGWAANGAVGDLAPLAIELCAIAVLALTLRPSHVALRTAAEHRPRPVLPSIVLVIGLAAGVSGAMLNPGAQQTLFDRAARERTGAPRTGPFKDDSLRVAVCGSSAPLPSASRAKACVAVFAGGRFYIVDAGPESVENLVTWGIPMDRIGGVLLTHFHSDHIGDLGELNLQTWAAGRPAPLEVYGGPGVEQVVDGFNSAYRLDQGYRTSHHTAKIMPPSTWPMVARTINFETEPSPDKGRMKVAYDDGSLQIVAIEVDHAPIAPAYAYRFNYKGRSAVVTGDLKFHPSLARPVAGADLLLSEAISLSMTRSLQQGAREAGRERAAAIMHDIEDYHITPEQAATVANVAGVKLLAFYHLLPSPDGILARQLFSRGVGEIRTSGWTIADDGSMYTMRIGGHDTIIGQITE
jgi:ribonuclease Z